MKKYSQLIFYIVTVIIMIAIILFSRYAKVDYTGIKNENRSYEKALVMEVISEETDPNEEGIVRGRQELIVKILTGEHQGEQFEISNSLYVTRSIYAAEGDTIVVCIDVSTSGDTVLVTVYSYSRTTAVYAIIGVFIAVFGLIGGKNGLRSCYSLLFTFVLIIFLLVPLVSLGIAPIPATIAVLIPIIVVSLISLLGFTRKTMIAVLSTSFGVLLCALIFFVFGSALHINGYNTEEVETLSVIAQHIQLRIKDLLFAGVMISSLGAVMDVSVSVASSITEVHELNPELSRKELFKSGYRIGRDINGTMANTLILAFTGTFFITLYLFRVYAVGYYHFMNMDTIIIEIAQALSGTLALAVTSPLTAGLGAYIQKK